MLAWTVQGIVNKSCISFQSRRDAKDVLLAVMGQADTLARCAGCAHCPCCLQYHGYHQLNHHHHFHPQAMPRVAFNFLLLNPCYLYLLPNLAIRCVNDCLRVSEEKEVLSEGAGAGSRFVARGWPEWIWRGLMQIFDDAMTRSSRPYDHLYMTIDHPHTGWYFLLFDP